MSSNDNRVFAVGKLDILELDVLDETLSSTPGLDSNTVLTIVTFTVDNGNILDIFSRATLTKTTNTVFF